MRLLPDNDDDYLYSPGTSDLMEQIHDALAGNDSRTAFIAVANILVLIVALNSRDKADAKRVLELVVPRLHRCMDDNYESAHQLMAIYEKRNAVLH